MTPSHPSSILPGVAVVPTFNERGNIARLIPRLRECVSGLHVLVVDDNSPDGTADIVRAQPDFGSQVHLLSRPSKQGLGRAYQAGFAWVLSRGYGKIVQMDADFSHDPADVPRLLAAVDDFDLAIGSRYVRGGGVIGWPMHRFVLSRTANLYARWMLGVSVNDLTGGFKCWRRNTLARVEVETLAAGGYVFQVESTTRALRLGLSIRELPIRFRERETGVSKMGLHIAMEGLARVFTLAFGPTRTGSRP